MAKIIDVVIELGNTNNTLVGLTPGTVIQFKNTMCNTIVLTIPKGFKHCGSYKIKKGKKKRKKGFVIPKDPTKDYEYYWDDSKSHMVAVRNGTIRVT